MKSFSQILAFSLPDLQKEIDRASTDLLQIRLRIASGSEANHSQYKKVRKYIARLQTARRQKEQSFSSSPLL